MFVKLVVLSAALAVAHGYSSGAPLSPEVCKTLTPKHPGAPQTSPAPYRVKVEPRQVSPGGIVTVTLSADETPFKGFLVQGRKINFDSEVAPQGRFVDENQDEAKTLSCGSDGSTITHTHSGEKTTVSLKWQAPQEPGAYTILASFVQSGKVYWVRQPSATVTVV